MRRPFMQVDVFTHVAFRGNPVAVILDGEGLDTEQMQRVAHWTNLSETVFLLPPGDQGADYRARIFTPTLELPFAGHPTLGACHAWLQASGGDREVVVQECGSGPVTVRRMPAGLAFAAPPLLRSGPVEDAVLEHVARVLNLGRGDIVDAEWVDNGPGWVGVLLESADAVLAVEPGLVDLDVGLAGPYPKGAEAAFEVRAFFPKDATTAEDPVTGSLNASLAQWLHRTGRARLPYVASQGRAVGRAGRVHLSMDDDETLWTAGGTVTCVEGTIDL